MSTTDRATPFRPADGDDSISEMSLGWNEPGVRDFEGRHFGAIDDRRGRPNERGRFGADSDGLDDSEVLVVSDEGDDQDGASFMNRKRSRLFRRRVLLGSGVSLAVSVVIGSTALTGDRSASISGAKWDDDGFLVHAVESEYQSGTTPIRVLLPDRREKGTRYPVVYVLPVEARNERRYGDGLLEVRRHDLHNRFRAIFVAPTFSHLPWYADHPSNPEIRQETYFLNVVLPFVEGRYPAQTGRDGRLLLGFSKSGWGAFSLLLRHPDVFGKAVAWDAPLMMDRQGEFNSDAVFGMPENFEGYRLKSLLKSRRTELGEDVRLVHMGYGNFRDAHEAFETLLKDLKLSHRYVDGPKREHRWESGWVPEAVGLLLRGR